MCTCDYRDNNWFHVLEHYLTIFRGREGIRNSLAEHLKARTEPGGVVSLDVGLPERLKCSKEHAAVYPGTNSLADIPELYSLLGSILWPQVRQTLMNICVPVRIALQLICQHAMLHVKDMEAAKAYALKAWTLYELVDKCVDDQTPFPFPGVGPFLKRWIGKELPDVSERGWYPEPDALRAKWPHESEQHYWPCVPLKDPLCFPNGNEYEIQSCSTCCDPGKGPTGDASCFVGPWTFNRCCNTPNDQGKFY